ncbi:MAG: DUF6266 family protein [Vibrio anguillarum]
MKQTADNVVFSNWKGKNTFRRKPVSYNDAKTAVQVSNRSKFKQIVLMCSALLIMVRVGFKSFANGVTTSNAAVKFCLDKVLNLTTLTKTDYLTMAVSQGSLATVAPITEAFTGQTGVIDIEWNDNSNGVNAFTDDILYVGGYDITTGAGGAVQTSETRADGITAVTIPQLIGAQPNNVVVFYFFKKATGTDVSDSQSF